MKCSDTEYNGSPWELRPWELRPLGLVNPGSCGLWEWQAITITVV